MLKKLTKLGMAAMKLVTTLLCVIVAAVCVVIVLYLIISDFTHVPSDASALSKGQIVRAAIYGIAPVWFLAYLVLRAEWKHARKEEHRTSAEVSAEPLIPPLSS